MIWLIRAPKGSFWLEYVELDGFGTSVCWVADRDRALRFTSYDEAEETCSHPDVDGVVVELEGAG